MAYHSSLLQHNKEQGTDLPAQQQALYLLDAHRVLMLALHLVDVVCDGGHGGQSVHNVSVPLRLRRRLFHYVL